MKFSLTVNMDNAAFETEDGNAASGGELARILERIADTVRADEFEGGETGSARDINGNKVAHWIVGLEGED